MATRITVNGREYASVESMPPDVRAVYERMIGGLADANRDGVPDILQGAIEPGRRGDFAEIRHSTVSVTYDRLEDMSPDVRRLHEEAMRRGDTGAPVQLGNRVTEFSVTPRTTKRGSTLSMTFSPVSLFLWLLLIAVVALIVLVWLKR